MWRRSKWLSLLLALSIMFLAVAPQASFASTNFNRTSSSVPQAYRSKSPKRLTELTDKRDQHSKTYLNSDGSYSTDVSIASLHYKDSQGKWQNISNKLVSSNEPGYSLKNEANSFETHFAQNSASNFLTLLKLDQNHQVSWSLDNSSKVTAVSDTTSVTYPEILTSTDLQYQPFSDGLKENIVLKNINAPNSFQFELKTNGITPVQQNDGSIALQDTKTGKTAFVIPKPYMYDKNHTLSPNVTMSVSPTQNPNVYAVFITADLNWLSDSSRSWPVTIDPSVTTQNWFTQTSSSGGMDTFISYYAPTTYYYPTSYMTTGYDSVNQGVGRALVKFPMPTLPSGAIVTDATMSVYKYTTTSTPSEQLDARRITGPWSNNVTWNTQPSVDTSYQQTEASTTNVAGSYIGWINFNVWSIVKGWVNGNIANDGIMIQQDNENNPLIFYYTSQSTSGDTPLLSITYINDEIGLNPYWGYANTSDGSVNTYNGNLLSSVTDFSLPGRGIPINVTRTYNSRVSLPASGLNSIFGQGWFSNLDMQLVFKNWGVIFLDSAQTERPFMLNSDDLTYTAPDNYPMQLYKDTSSGTTVYHVQEANQEKGTYQSQLPAITFNSSGQLTQLSDGKGNLTNITWSSGSVTIQDPSGRTATLSQNADGTVSQITTSAETGKVKASYTYSGGYLTSVTYDNGSYPSATVNYTWNNGLLSSLTDKNGTKQIINYNSNNQVISVGTVNMLSNPGMEASTSTNASTPDNWSPTASSDLGNIKQTNVAKYGRFSMDIQSVYQSGTTGTSYLYATQKIPVCPNQTYTLSSLIKTANLGGSSSPNTSSAEAFLNIDQLGSSGNDLYLWNDSRASGISGTTDWTPNNITVATSSTTYYLVVYLEVQHDTTHFGGDAYFDGVQLEPGASATSFEGHTDFRYGTDNSSGTSYEAVWATAPNGEVTEYKNDNYGTPVAVIDDPRDGSPVSETDLSWNAADRLLSLTTPNQVNAKSGKSYSYQYDALGNMTKATDPSSNSTNMNYYYNRLQTLTQADGSTVQHIWDPVNLNEDTSTDQTLDSQAYSYNQGNVTTESNLLGVADNRILNGSFEQLSGNQPVNWTANTPSGAYNQADYTSVSSTADGPFADSSGNSHVLHINPGNNNTYAYQWTSYINLAGPTTDSFTVSGYLKAVKNSNTTPTPPHTGACLNVYWYNSSYTQVGSTVVEFQDTNPNWQRLVATIQPPTGGASYAKVMAITYGAYDGYFDNIMFEKSQLARGFNMLENSSFEQSSTQWINSDGSATIVNDGSNTYSGSYDAQINRTSIGTSYWQSQTILPVNTSQYYTLLGYIKTNNIVAGSGGGGARLHVYFYNSSGSQINSYAIPLISQTSGWTKYVLPFTPPANSATIKVSLDLYNAQGTAVFDNIRLSPGNLATTTSYDTLNNYSTGATDQLGNTTTISPDPYGQTQQVTSPGGTNTSYSYDGQERLRTVTDNAGNITTYNLDANGNVLSAGLAAGGKTYDSESFTYDRDNNLQSETDANSNTTNYTYNQDGDLTQKTNPNGTSVSTSYDDYGNLMKILLSGGPTYNMGYDLEGNLTSSSITNGPSSTYGYDALGNMTSYVEKDAGGNTVTTVGAPSAPSGTSMYSKLNQLLGFDLKYGTNSPITYNFSYAKNGLVSSVAINPGSSTQQQVTFNYDENNNLVSRVNPNNTQDNFTYNDANQIIGMQTVDNAGNLKWSNQYSYDQTKSAGKDGKLTSIAGTDPGGNNYAAGYTYNDPSNTEKLNRLAQATITDGAYSGTFNYSYDPAGNLLTMDTANGTAAMHFIYVHLMDS